MQRLRGIVEKDIITADAADAWPAELVRYRERPLMTRTLLTVLCQYKSTRPVIDIVNGSAARQLLVDAVPLLVVAVDIRILLHHLVSVLYAHRVIPRMRDNIFGEGWRKYVADIALYIIYIVCLALASLTDQHPAFQVGILGMQTAVLVNGAVTEVWGTCMPTPTSSL